MIFFLNILENNIKLLYILYSESRHTRNS